MRNRARIFMLAVAFGAVACVGLHAELTLCAKVDGVNQRVTGIRGEQLLVGDGSDSHPIPFTNDLVVEGPLSDSASLIHWYPIYHPVLATVRDGIPDRPAFGYVRITNSLGWYGFSLDEVWSKRPSAPALVVLAWVASGKITQTRSELVPVAAKLADFRLDATFQLSPAEVAGQGVVLLWVNGHFIAPTPSFSDPHHQNALERMMVGDMEGFRAALDRGFNPGGHGRNDMSLLDFAAESGNTEAIGLLLKRGVKISFEHGLDLAAQKGRLAAVEELLDAGAVPADPLIHWMLDLGHDAIAMTLLKHRAPLQGRQDRFLKHLIYLGNVSAAATMMERGADFQFARQNGARNLVEQVERGHAGMTKFLLEHKVDPNLLVDGRTALMMAAKAGDLPITELLLHAGAKPDLAAPGGPSPLLVAVAANHSAVAQALVRGGADVKQKSRGGPTALHYAALNNDVPLISLLLERGAAINAAGAGGQRPLDMALLAGAAEASRLLASRGGKCDLAGPGRPALIEAAIGMDVPEIVSDAIRDGWRPDTLLNGKWPLRWLAEVMESSRVLEVLRTNDATQTTPPVVVSQAELDAPVKLIEAKAPIDPRETTFRQTRETVEVLVFVDEEGRVDCPKVVGDPSGRLKFGALQHVRTLRFSHPTKNGKPVATRVSLPIVYVAEPVPRDITFVDAAPLVITQFAFPEELIGLPSGNVGRPNLYRGVYERRPYPPAPVVVELIIDARGRGTPVNVSSSNAGQNAVELAKKEIPNWVFTPAIRDGVPVPCRMYLEVYPESYRG